MSLFSLFNNAVKEEVVAVFDIGNGSVCAALVKVSPGQLPFIIYSHREPLTYIPEVTSKKLLDSMLKLLRSVTVNLEKEGMAKLQPYNVTRPHRALCVFSSPWYVSQSKVIHVQKETHFVVTQNPIDSMIRKEQEAFKKDQEEGKYEEMFGHAVRILEKQIISMKLNGYEIEKPLNKKARELEVTFFTSFIAEAVIQGVEKILGQYIHVSAIAFASYALASWTAIRDTFPQLTDFIFLDVTGEVTDISITQRSVLSETMSFPIGRNTILREMVSILNVPPEVAHSFLELYTKGKAEAQFKVKIESIIKKVAQQWIADLEQSFKIISNARPLSKKIFMTVDPDVGFIFCKILSDN